MKKQDVAEKYFRQYGVTGADLLEMEKSMLIEFGMKNFHAKSLMREVEKLPAVQKEAKEKADKKKIDDMLLKSRQERDLLKIKTPEGDETKLPMALPRAVEVAGITYAPRTGLNGLYYLQADKHKGKCVWKHTCQHGYMFRWSPGETKWLIVNKDGNALGFHTVADVDYPCEGTEWMLFGQNAQYEADDNITVLAREIS